MFIVNFQELKGVCSIVVGCFPKFFGRGPLNKTALFPLDIEVFLGSAALVYGIKDVILCVLVM